MCGGEDQRLGWENVTESTHLKPLHLGLVFYKINLIWHIKDMGVAAIERDKDGDRGTKTTSQKYKRKGLN